MTTTGFSLPANNLTNSAEVNTRSKSCPLAVSASEQKVSGFS